MSRLDFAPGTGAMEVTDIERGRFVFPPRPDRPVRLEELDRALTEAGYEMERAWIEVHGELQADTLLRAGGTGQRFHVSWAQDVAPPERFPVPAVVYGEWRSAAGREAVRVERLEPAEEGGGP